MLNRNSNLVLWLGVLAMLACTVSASATVYYYTNSSIGNYFTDVTKWNTATNGSSGSYPVVSDFANPVNQWVFLYNKSVLVAPNTSPATNWSVAGPVTYRSALGISGPLLTDALEHRFFFNGNLSNSAITATFDDLRLQGEIATNVTRGATLAGNLRLITDANGVQRHTAFKVKGSQTGGGSQQLFVDSLIDASDCNGIDILYWDTSANGGIAGNSNLQFRHSNNRIYSQFTLDGYLYATAAGSLGDADVQLNGPSTTDYRAGKLLLQNASAISATATVSLITNGSVPGAMNTDPVRIDLGTNNVTIRELWIDNVKQTGTNITFNSSSAWMGTTSGTLTVSNTPTQNVTTATSPAGDPNLRIFPPVGTKAYAEGYVVTLVAPTVSTAPYIFKQWTGGTVANPSAATTTLTVPTGSGISVTANYDASAYNPSPVNTAINVSNWTGLSWTAAPGSSAQTVYFGTVNPPVAAVTASGNTVTNASLGGRLADNVTYYWRVDSTIGGNVIAGQVWSFTAANSVPNTPSPLIGAVVAISGTRLTWTESPTGGAPTLHSVYFSTNQSAVVARSAATIVPDANGWYNTGGPLVQGATYYWAVDATYQTKVSDVNTPLGQGVGPVWSLICQKKTLYIKTEIAGYNVNGAGDVNGVASGIYIDDANVINYTFPTFNYGSDWDIVVSGPKSFAIWSNASITVGGTVDISGYVNTAATANGAPAHAGANAGCPAGQGNPFFGTASVNGIGAGGQVMNNTSGAGAGYGGKGGIAGRYSTCNGGAGGIVYGQLQMFDLFAGSGGGGGKDSSSWGGAGGGGAIELYAKAGNVDILSTANIRANGGSATNAGYPAGAGSGGGVRIVASGNVTMAGTITANGGRGGNCTGTNNNNTGGGGGGGRAAIYKGGAYTQTGTITATGGACGVNTPTTGSPTTFAKPGADGTIYTSGVTSTLLAACNPAPTDGAGAWSLDPNFGGSKTLSWNPALGTTQNKLYLSTVKTDVQNGVAGALKTTISAPANSFLRARKTFTPSPALVNGTRYYWRVDTNGVAGPVWSFGVGTCAKPAGDLNGDCKVTFADFAMMASQWQVCNLAGGSGCI